MDRLRKIDALFAEKVLRLNPASWLGTYEWSTLPHYTRSLDAAWEGFLKVRLGEHDVDLGTNGTVWWACIGELDCYQDREFYGEGSHPAEALVLACLQAVGCTEEEINESIEIKED